MSESGAGGLAPLRRQLSDVRALAWTLSVFTAGVATGLAAAILVAGGAPMVAGAELALALAGVAVAAIVQVRLAASSGRRWVKHKPRLRTRLRRLRPSVRRPKPASATRVRRG